MQFDSIWVPAVPWRHKLCVLFGLAEDKLQPLAVTDSKTGQSVVGVFCSSYGIGGCFVNRLQLDCSPFG